MAHWFPKDQQSIQASLSPGTHCHPTTQSKVQSANPSWSTNRSRAPSSMSPRDQVHLYLPILLGRQVHHVHRDHDHQGRPRAQSQDPRTQIPDPKCRSARELQ